MKCLECGTEMKCVDDVNTISTRIDWEKCPKCGATVEIEYSSSVDLKLKRVLWKRKED